MKESISPVFAENSQRKRNVKQDGDSGNSNDPFMSAVHIQVMQLVFESSFIRVQLLPDQIEISLKFRGIAAGKRGKSRIRKKH